MAEIRDPSVVNQLKEFAEATCLIEAGRYKGTGFHFGSGWIMSVAHNFQNNATDNPHLHSLLSSAKFTFTIDGTECVFSSAENRMAFIHHLQPGDEVDPRNMDIALVKLGIQYEYARRNDDYNDWERKEQQKLDKMGLTCFASIEEREVTEDEKVYAIHYGGGGNRKKVQLTVKRVEQIRNSRPTIQLQPATQPGASGSPILNQQYRLVGLLFGGGDPDDPNAADDALMWNGGIKNYVDNGVSIIAHIGSYMAFTNMEGKDQAMMNEELQKRASDEKTQLMKNAKDSKLTIYLMNGEVFNGQNC